MTFIMFIQYWKFYNICTLSELGLEDDIILSQKLNRFDKILFAILKKSCFSVIGSVESLDDTVNEN